MRNTRDRSGIGSCHSCGSLPGELDLPQIAPSVDWINVMTYDFHGAWESSGPTNHSSALFRSSCETTGGTGPTRRSKRTSLAWATVRRYKVLAARSSTPFWDEETGTHWTLDGSTFWSFDDSQSASWKADYANCRGLRGTMFWELSGDGPTGSLLTGLSTQLRNASSSCHSAWPQSP
jgi:chitinase